MELDGLENIIKATHLILETYGTHNSRARNLRTLSFVITLEESLPMEYISVDEISSKVQYISFEMGNGFQHFAV